MQSSATYVANVASRDRRDEIFNSLRAKQVFRAPEVLKMKLVKNYGQ